MKQKKCFVIPVIAMFAIIGVIITLVFFPVNAVNVIFERRVNPSELTAVFQDTSFKVYQYYSVDSEGAKLSVTSNSQLFVTPDDTALDGELRDAGIIVLDGNISLIDVAKIKKNSIVDDVIVYFPIFDMGDRDILPKSSSQFFDKHPEARYWG